MLHFVTLSLSTLNTLLSYLDALPSPETVERTLITPDIWTIKNARYICESSRTNSSNSANSSTQTRSLDNLHKVPLNEKSRPP